MAIGAIISGPITTRIGERNAMILSNLLTSVAAFAQIMYPTPEVLVIMTAVFSLGSGFMMSAYSPFMTRTSTRYERTHLFGSSQAISIGTSFVGSILGGFLPGLFALTLALPVDSPPTFQLALISWFIPIGLAIIPLLFVGEETRDVKPIDIQSDSNDESTSTESQNPSSETKGRYKTVIKFLIYTYLIGLGAGFIVPLMNVWFKEFYGFPTEVVGVLTGFGQATMAAGVLLAPVLSSRIGKVKTLVLTQALSLPFILFLAYFIDPMIAIISYLLRMVLMNASNPVGASFRMEIMPTRWRPNFAAAHTAVTQFGRSTSIQISGQLFDQGLFQLPFWYTLGLYSAGVTLYALFFWRTEEELEEEQKEKVPATPDLTSIE